jgi:hypothetical protein
VADKSSQLLVSALSRAAAEPNGLPLHGNKAAPGLFPTTPLGKQTAQRCVQDGYLRPCKPPDQRFPVSDKPKSPSELYTITDKGLSFLFHQANPRQVLEDLVRVLEARQTQATELLHLAGQMRTDVIKLKASTEQVLQQVPRTESLTAAFAAPPPPNGAYLAEKRATPTAEQVAALHRAVQIQLARWQASGAAEDYPLAELFRHLQADVPGLTIGRFHDALRDLHDADRIYLHPWTGPLYDLPEPAFALLVGHLIAYYASARSQLEAVVEEPAMATVLRFPLR